LGPLNSTKGGGRSNGGTVGGAHTEPLLLVGTSRTRKGASFGPHKL